MTEDNKVEFPDYQPPANPSGLQTADRKQSSILWKLTKQLTKPRPRLKTPKTKNWKKKQIFY